MLSKHDVETCEMLSKHDNGCAVGPGVGHLQQDPTSVLVHCQGLKLAWLPQRPGSVYVYIDIE